MTDKEEKNYLAQALAAVGDDAMDRIGAEVYVVTGMRIKVGMIRSIDVTLSAGNLTNVSYTVSLGNRIIEDAVPYENKVDANSALAEKLLQTIKGCNRRCEIEKSNAEYYLELLTKLRDETA